MRASTGAALAGGRGETLPSAMARQPLARQPLAHRRLHSHRPFSTTAVAPAGSQSGKGRAWCEARVSLEGRGTGNADGECLMGSLSGLHPSSAAGDVKSQSQSLLHKYPLIWINSFYFLGYCLPQLFQEREGQQDAVVFLNVYFVSKEQLLFQRLHSSHSSFQSRAGSWAVAELYLMHQPSSLEAPGTGLSSRTCTLCFAHTSAVTVKSCCSAPWH